MDIDAVLEKIQNNPVFLQLKNVTENFTLDDGKAWHDHEPVFNHSLKTLRIARERIAGDFITNPKAKELFEKWKEQDVFGVKQKDLTLLIALIHDCGKILHYKEGDKKETLITPFPNSSEYVMCPGHEYWGAKNSCS